MTAKMDNTRVAQLALDDVDPFPSDPEARVKAASAWYTPTDPAKRLAAMSEVLARRHWDVLEPSAGHGALALAVLDVYPPARITAVDLDRRAVPTFLSRLTEHEAVSCGGTSVTVECCDYMTRAAPASRYDLAICNTPYEDGQDSEHLAKVMSESNRVTALLRLAMLESQRAWERVWSQVATERHSEREWRLLEMHPFVVRPAFLPGGAESDGGKTAFMAVKLSRVSNMAADPWVPAVGTHISWW